MKDLNGISAEPWNLRRAELEVLDAFAPVDASNFGGFRQTSWPLAIRGFLLKVFASK